MQASAFPIDTPRARSSTMVFPGRGELRLPAFRATQQRLGVGLPRPGSVLLRQSLHPLACSLSIAGQHLESRQLDVRLEPQRVQSQRCGKHGMSSARAAASVGHRPRSPKYVVHPFFVENVRHRGGRCLSGSVCRRLGLKWRGVQGTWNGHCAFRFCVVRGCRFSRLTLWELTQYGACVPVEAGRRLGAPFHDTRGA